MVSRRRKHERTVQEILNDVHDPTNHVLNVRAGNNVLVESVALGQSSGDAGVLSWQNPESVAILAAIIIDITTAQAAQTVNVGVASAGSGASDTLIDGASLATPGAISSFSDGGTNGKAFRKVDANGGANDFITATASGTPSSLVGTAYIVYIKT